MFWQRGSELARVCLFVYDPSLFLLNIAQVIERARTIETGVCVHGRGNEFTVRDHGNDIAHRPLGVINAAPKAAAWVGYTCVKIARKFWNSKAGDLAQGLAQEMLVLA